MLFREERRRKDGREESRKEERQRGRVGRREGNDVSYTG